METPAIKDVSVSEVGKTITFRMEDGSTREIEQPYEFPSRDVISHCMVAIAAALLQAYDRLDALEQRINSLEG